MSGAAEAGLARMSQGDGAATGPAPGEEHPHRAQGTFRSYMTGFVMSVVLTSVPFWLVMSGVLNDTLKTSIVVMALAAVQIVVHMTLLPAHEHEVGGRLDLHRAGLHPYPRRRHLGRLDMGHVSHGPEHDADVAARGADKALTGRRIAALVAFDLAAILLVAGLVALAAWQVHRRAWKLDLVTRIEARAHANPTSAPGLERWADISAAADEYRRVTVTSRWLEERPALVQAVTELGGGYWVMTPLARDEGTTVFINRGFAPADERDPAAWGAPNAGLNTVTGLLRMSEPGGAFLRSNDPAADRWFSRDVAAIAASRGLPAVAPYFIDAESAPGQSGLPVAGLTVLSFSNNHLIYALTWGALALMTGAGAIFINLEASRSGRFRPGLDES